MVIHLLPVDVCLVFCQYYIIARDHRNQQQARSVRADSSTHEWFHLFYRPTYGTSHLFYHEWYILIYNQPCTVLSNTTIISKDDLKKLLSVFVDFLSMFASCCVESSSICCRYFLGLTIETLSVICPYYRECSQAGSARADSSTHKRYHLLYRTTYWKSHLSYHEEM